MNNREIDKLIAEKVMGLETKCDRIGGCLKRFNTTCKCDSDKNYPNYSTNIEDAWKVIEKLKKNEIYLQIYINGMEGYEVVYLKTELSIPIISSNKERTAPLAISKAALKVYGIEV